jgi:hypothetical protein
LLKEFVYVFEQVIQVLLNYTPYNPIVDGVISVNQDVSERNDVAVVADARQK